MKPHHIVIDLAHFADMWVKMHFHRNTPSHYLNYIVEGKNPVVIIPGVGNKWGALKHLSDYISLKGHPVYIVHKLGFNYKDIPESAKIVREVIDENNLKDVVLVGHSKGGLIGKHLLIHFNKDNRVKGLVSLATPYSGSHLAKFLLLKRWTIFSPHSSRMEELMENKDVNKKIISISPKTDTVVWHKDRSFLRNALENIEVNSHGHVRLTYSKEVQEIVLQAIEKVSKT